MKTICINIQDTANHGEIMSLIDNLLDSHEIIHEIYLTEG